MPTKALTSCLLKTVEEMKQESRKLGIIKAMDDPDEVYDSLKCLREDMLVENDKLMGLNKFIADAEKDIDMKEGHIQMLKAAGESD
ncbi:hypothetical protein Tco_0710159 [Tanacetum coccineum]